MRILVTGASGFVGRALVARLAQGNDFVRAMSRLTPTSLCGNVKSYLIAEASPETDWRGAVEGIDAVVHLMARVHDMTPTSSGAVSQYHRTNVLTTKALATAASEAGVRRFIFISSVKANGESGRFDEQSPLAPVDAYGASKAEAEEALRSIARATGMEVVVVRPPLVYGPGVRANFRILMRVVSSGVPLPLGAVNNRRSLVSVDNLVDFLVRALSHPAAGNETFMVSDGEDLSTPELIRRLARALGKRARLVSVPVPLLERIASLVGKEGILGRLTGDLQVRIDKALRLIHWKPVLSVEEGLHRAAREFLKEKSLV